MIQLNKKIYLFITLVIFIIRLKINIQNKEQEQEINKYKSIFTKFYLQSRIWQLTKEDKSSHSLNINKIFRSKIPFTLFRL